MADPEEFSSMPSASEDPTLARGLLPVIFIPTDEAWLVLAVASLQNFFLKSIPLSMLVFASTDSTPHGHLISVEQGYIAGATFFGLIYLFSPFSCALINWYSFKTISILGPALAIFSMIFGYYVIDQFVIFLFVLSLLGGFGCSMINMTSACLPTVWFCNKRALACRISGLGSALGILLLPCLIREFFLQAFGCCATLLYWVYAGMYVILLSAGCLVPKMRAILIQVSNQSTSESKVRFADQEDAEVMAKSMSIFGKDNPLLKTCHNLFFPRVKDIIKERGIFLLIPTDSMQKAANPPYRTRRQQNRPVLHADEGSVINFNVAGVQEVRMVLNPSIPGYGARPFYRVDIFFSGDIRVLNLYSRQANQLDFHLAATRAMTRMDYLQEVNKKCLWWPEAIPRTILTMLNCGQCRHLYYLLLQFAMFLYYAGSFIPFIFIKDRGLEFGIDEGVSYLLMYSVGLGNVAGHLMSLLTLFCCDVQKTLVFIYAVMLQGLATCASNYVAHITIQVLYAVLTGIILGFTSSMDVTIIYNVTGIHTLTNAIGHQQLIKGLGLIFGIILSVQINSATGSVVNCFHASGFCMVLASLSFLPMKNLKSLARNLDFASL